VLEATQALPFRIFFLRRLHAIRGTPERKHRHVFMNPPGEVPDGRIGASDGRLGHPLRLALSPLRRPRYLPPHQRFQEGLRHRLEPLARHRKPMCPNPFHTIMGEISFLADCWHGRRHEEFRPRWHCRRVSMSTHLQSWQQCNGYPTAML
jgi:hypothetical protein